MEINAKHRTCLKCGTAMESYLYTTAYSIICSSCGTIHLAHQENLQDSGKTVQTDLGLTDLKIGDKGKLFGVNYLVTSIARRQERNTEYTWLEYTLYNPIHGIAYLSEYDGHWIYLKELGRVLENAARVVTYDGATYNLFSSYTSVLTAAKGEYLYSIVPKESVRVKEFVMPAEMVSEEITDDVYSWLHGKHVPHQEIKSAFKLNNIAKPIGIGVIQPFLSKFNERTLINICVVIVGLWLALQVFFYYDAKEIMVFQEDYSIDDSKNKKEIYTKAFDIPEGSKNVELKINTNISNSWMYTGMSLVNEVTGDIYDLDLEAEYYMGYEDGEYWTEGKSWMSKVISKIPGGRYYLIIYPEKPGEYGYVNLSVKLTRDVFVLSNGLILLAALALFPAFYFYRRNSFERKRWSNSDYSPYEYE